jgi:hypothetical protein
MEEERLGLREREREETGRDYFHSSLIKPSTGIPLICMDLH